MIHFLLELFHQDFLPQDLLSTSLYIPICFYLKIEQIIIFFFFGGSQGGGGCFRCTIASEHKGGIIALSSPSFQEQPLET